MLFDYEVWILFTVMKNKKAFTLAEVLITLSIIGVVAAMTIPSLMQSTQDAELKSAWKTAYSELANVTNQIANENGGNLKGLCSDNDHNCFRDFYKSHMKVIKSCDSGQNSGKCWQPSGAFWALDGSTPSVGIFSGLVLAKGTFINFYYSSSNCDDPGWSFPRCGRIDVDINGFKGPNKYGKDIFPIHVISSGLKPFGTQEDDLPDNCENTTGTASGFSCSAAYLRE